jgi:hypothetical protein
LFPEFAVNSQMDATDRQQVDVGFGLAGFDPVADPELPFPDAWRCGRHGVVDAFVRHGNLRIDSLDVSLSGKRRMHLLHIARKRLRHYDAAAGSRELARRPYFLGASQASVTALSIMCRSSLLHCGQVKVRKSWPNALGSIAVNFIGESHAAHCGPWFCVSSMLLSCSGRGQRSLSALALPGNAVAATRARSLDDHAPLVSRAAAQYCSDLKN